LVASGGLMGCILDEDVDKFDFQLPEKTFTLDAAEFGVSTTTTIECVAGEQECQAISSALVCDAQDGVCVLSDEAVFPDVACSEQQDVCAQFGTQVTCDTELQACIAEVQPQLSASVHLSEEVPELQEVGNLTFAEVTLETFYFDVEINSLGVRTPELGVFVADNSVGELEIDEAGEAVTQGAARIGTIPPMEIGFTGRKDVILTQQGRDALKEKIKSPSVPFKLFVAGPVVLEPGDPLPDLETGQLKVIVSGTATAQTSL
jgi:hypothetical protein